MIHSIGKPKLKITSELKKATLPDRKRLVRAVEPDGNYIQHIDLPAPVEFHELRETVMVSRDWHPPATGRFRTYGVIHQPGRRNPPHAVAGEVWYAGDE